MIKTTVWMYKFSPGQGESDRVLYFNNEKAAEEELQYSRKLVERVDNQLEHGGIAHLMSEPAEISAWRELGFLDSPTPNLAFLEKIYVESHSSEKRRKMGEEKMNALKVSGRAKLTPEERAALGLK